MKMGNTYRLRDIGRAALTRMASEMKLDPGATLARAQELADSLPTAARTLREQLVASGVDTPLLRAMEKELSARAARCAKLIA